MKGVTRRDFVKSSLAAGAVLAVPFSRVRGANDDIRVAVVGINGRGGGLIGSFHNTPGVRVAALCDVDGNALDREVKRFKDRNERLTATTTTGGCLKTSRWMWSALPRRTIGTFLWRRSRL